MSYGAAPLRKIVKRPKPKPWPSEQDAARWRTDLTELVAYSQHTRVWLRMHGAGSPIEYTRAISLELIAAMSVYAWAPCLVTDLLSKREYQVFIGHASGLLGTEIAARIFCSPKTVVTFGERIRHKTGLRNNTEFAIFAYRHGLVKWGPLPVRPVEATDTPKPPPELGVHSPAPARVAPGFSSAGNGAAT